MLNKNKIATVVESFLGGTDKFLVEVEVSSGNVVDVFVDGDEGISISECVSISRHIESNFDRDLEDYELRVSSPGLTKPFAMLRQYKKYVNRDIKIKLADGRKELGKLISITEETITLEMLKGKKKKESVTEEFQFDDVKEAKPVISFK